MTMFLLRKGQPLGTRAARARFRPCLEELEERAVPAVLTVNSTADDTSPGGVLTLREAVALVDGTLGRGLTSDEQAQVSGTLGSNDLIQFDLPGGSQTITLTGGELDLTRPVTVAGPGAGALTIDGNHQSRVFTVGHIFTPDRSLVVSLSGLTVADGSNDYGAGLLNLGTLTLTDMVFAGNAAGNHGGGAIYNAGALTLRDSTLSGNSTGGAGAGGGIDNIGSGRLTVSNTTFAGNGCGIGSGGGIFSSGTATVSGCTFSGNSSAADGAGINADGPLTVSGCTFVGNSAGSDGGAIWNDNALTVAGCTLAGNSAVSDGGGIYNNPRGTVTVVGCTLAGNSAGSDGGGIQNEGVVALTGVTLTANRAVFGSGGGINNQATLTVHGGTLSGNTAAHVGGGINNTGTLTMTGTALFGNTAGAAGGALLNNGTAVLTNDRIVANRAVAGAGGGLFNMGGRVVLFHSLVAGDFRGPAPGTTPSDLAGLAVDRSSSYNVIGTRGGGLVNGVHHNRVGLGHLRLSSRRSGRQRQEAGPAPL